MASDCNPATLGLRLTVSALQLSQRSTSHKIPCFVSRKLQKFLLECAQHYLSLVQPVEPSFMATSGDVICRHRGNTRFGARIVPWLFEAHDMGESSLRRITARRSALNRPCPVAIPKDPQQSFSIQGAPLFPWRSASAASAKNLQRLRHNERFWLLLTGVLSSAPATVTDLESLNSSSAASGTRRGRSSIDRWSERSIA